MVNKQEFEDMPLTNEADFDELISGGNRVGFKNRVKKTLIITNWRKRQRDIEDTKTGETKKVVVFVADVLEEDGRPVEGKELRETSKRFAKEIMPIVMRAIKDQKSKVKVSVIKKEDPNNQYGTEWWVEEQSA